MPNLVWNPAAAAVAQNYANRCVFAHNANRGPYGENLYMTSANDPTGSPVNAVNAWAAEVQWYNIIAGTVRLMPCV